MSLKENLGNSGKLALDSPFWLFIMTLTLKFISQKGRF